MRRPCDSTPAARPGNMRLLMKPCWSCGAEFEARGEILTFGTRRGLACCSGGEVDTLPSVFRGGCTFGILSGSYRLQVGHLQNSPGGGAPPLCFSEMYYGGRCALKVDAQEVPPRDPCNNSPVTPSLLPHPLTPLPSSPLMSTRGCGGGGFRCAFK